MELREATPEKLWIASYAKIFDIDPQNTDAIPSPCDSHTPVFAFRELIPIDISLSDFTNNDPNYQARVTQLVNRILDHPRLTANIRDFTRRDSALDREFGDERRRLREQWDNIAADRIAEIRREVDEERRAEERALGSCYAQRRRALDTSLATHLGLSPIPAESPSDEEPIRDLPSFLQPELDNQVASETLQALEAETSNPAVLLRVGSELEESFVFPDQDFVDISQRRIPPTRIHTAGT
jgi:hypothetical protein